MSVGDLLTEQLGEYTDHGEERSYCCPFCEKTGRTADTEEKLYVNLSKKLFVCFRCETKGSLGYLLRRLGVEYQEDPVQVSKLAKRIRRLQGAPVEEDDVVEEEEQSDVVDYMAEITSNYCTPIEVGSAAWRYLRDRKLTDDDIDFYDIICGKGRYRNRVIVPTFGADSQLQYFVARAYKPVKMKAKDGTYKDAPKYLNPRGHGRNHSVFNLNRAVEFDRIIVTEGVFSAIAAGRNAVATYGKLVSDFQLDLIASAADSREVVVCLDGDAHAQTVDVARRLHERNVTVTLAILPFEHDPDSIGKEGLKTVLDERMPYSSLTVARLQASGAVKMKKKSSPTTSRNHASLDAIRKKLMG